MDRKDLFPDRISEAATEALGFIEGLSLENFENDPTCRYAVAMCLIVIGENVARLVRYHPEFVNAHAGTRRTQAIGMRNRIAHLYQEIDFAIGGRTITEYLPELLRTRRASRLPEPDC